MSNVLQALAMALGGGAGALGQGFGQVGQNIERRRSARQDDIFKQQQLGYEGQQVDIAREQAAGNTQHQVAMAEQQHQQTILAQRQLDQAIASARSVEERNQLLDQREKLQTFAQSWEKGGNSLQNPEKAYGVLNDPRQGYPSLVALNQAIGRTRAGMGNQPWAVVNDPAAADVGGVSVQGHSFNPNVGQSGANGAWGDDALKFKNSQDFRKALGDAQNRIRMVKRDAYNSYTANPAIAKLIGSVDATEDARGRKEAEGYATTQARRSAQAELNTLQSAYGDTAAGWTVDALLGDMPVGSGGATPSTAPPPGGMPQRPGAPPPSTDPNDPLGLFQGRKTTTPPPQAGASRPATPPAFDPADPLGLRRRP